MHFLDNAIVMNNRPNTKFQYFLYSVLYPFYYLIMMLKKFVKYVSQNMLGMVGMSVYILADTYFISVAGR